MPVWLAIKVLIAASALLNAFAFKAEQRYLGEQSFDAVQCAIYPAPTPLPMICSLFYFYRSLIMSPIFAFFRDNRPQISVFAGIAIAAAFILLSYNLTYWGKSWVYSEHSIGVQLSSAIILFSLVCAVLAAFAQPYLLKVVMIFLVWIGAGASYFVDNFGIIIDHDMLTNVLQTDAKEASDLLNANLVLHMVLFGVLPTFMIVWTRLTMRPFFRQVLANSVFAISCLLIAGVVFAPSYANFSSLLRNNKDLHQSLHPYQPIYAGVKLAKRSYISHFLPFERIGLDAIKGPRPIGAKPRLVVFVLGETARAKSFSLNGYERETNPVLSKESVFNFSQVQSCGTATAISVPCLMSKQTHATYNSLYAGRSENVLDVAQRAGVQVAWFNNNSGAKAQADRIPYFDVAHSDDAAFCDEIGCFDEILLAKLKPYLTALPKQDSLVVLHQLGSHGPTYFKRVPQALKVFQPECATSHLNECSDEQITNSYDNTVFHTDRVLGDIIDYLKTQEAVYDTAMLYVSDHGESTGENGVYLHGMPYLLAPDEQRHVPMILWASKGFTQSAGIDTQCLLDSAERPLSHDFIFSSLLAMVNVVTQDYDADLDLIKPCQNIRTHTL